MKALLNIIRDRLKADTTLDYLRWVEVLDDEDILPDGFAFPAIGLRDNGIPAPKILFSKKDEDLRVMVICYAALVRGVGSSVMGDSTLSGNAGKGVLDITKDIRASLKFDKDTPSSDYKTALEDAGYYSLPLPAEDASQTLVSPDGDNLVQKQAVTFAYRRRSDA